MRRALRGGDRHRLNLRSAQARAIHNQTVTDLARCRTVPQRKRLLRHADQLAGSRSVAGQGLPRAAGVDGRMHIRQAGDAGLGRGKGEAGAGGRDGLLLQTARGLERYVNGELSLRAG